MSADRPQTLKPHDTGVRDHRVVEWFVTFPVLVLSIVAIVISVIDLFRPAGIDVLPTAVQGEHRTIVDAVRIVVLLLGILSAALAADRIWFFQATRRSLDQLHALVGSLVNELDVAARVLPTREDVYAAFLHVLLEAPHGSKVFITHYEKLKMPFEAGENRAESALLRTWDEKIASGAIEVEQLVHITTLDDLAEAQRRIDARRDRPNYVLTALVGYLPSPFFECVIVGDVAIVNFSAQPGSPYATDFGVSIRSEAFAAKMREHFRMTVSQFGVPLKTRDAVQESNIESLRGDVPGGHPLDLPPDLTRKSLAMARDRSIYALLARLSDLAQAVDRLEQDLFRDRLRRAIAVCADEGARLAGGTIAMGSEGMYELLRLVHTAEDTVDAVCLSDDLDFWSTDIGKSLRDACRDAVSRNVAVRRIFIVAGELHNLDSRLVRELGLHYGCGIDVYVVSAHSLTDDSRRDYAMIDGTLVFEDAAGRQSSSRIDVGPAEVEMFSVLWQRTLLLARRWTPDDTNST